MRRGVVSAPGPGTPIEKVPYLSTLGGRAGSQPTNVVDSSGSGGGESGEESEGDEGDEGESGN